MIYIRLRRQPKHPSRATKSTNNKMLDCILSKVLPKSAYNFYTQSFPPASKWSTEDIPDLTGKLAIGEAYIPLLQLTNNS